MRTNTSRQSIAQNAVEEKSFLQGLVYEVKLAFFTISFIIFCVVAVALAWLISQWFTNDSYKAVVFFLDLIMVSNIASKYIIWVVKT